MKAFGIFEGGGAKGLAHIGALKVAEEKGIEFRGVAGSSAGSIVAALVAAGYKADELFDPGRPKADRGVFDKNFLDFFDSKVWAEVTSLRDDIKHTFASTTALRAWLKTPIFYVRNRRLMNRLITRQGFFSTDAFVNWLNPLLTAKVMPGSEAPVRFRDLNDAIPLSIIATDLTHQTIKVYNKEKTPDDFVADAVAASISIPFIFEPRRVKQDGGVMELVDGGLLSNFPAWVFDDERCSAGPLTPTFGFKLVEQPKKSESRSFFSFLTELFETTLAGDEQLEMRQIDNMFIIPLRVSVSTLDFDIDDGEKGNLYREGRAGAFEFFFRYMGPRTPQSMTEDLQILHSYMLKQLDKGDVHLRLYVMMPLNRNRLRVYYTFNMDDDPDDQVELNAGVGAAGRCWETRDFVVCDLTEVKQTYKTKWKMDKYQIALLRPSLKSLLSVPLGGGDGRTELDPAAGKEQNSISGVLIIDSDEDLLAEFRDAKIQQEAVRVALAVAKRLNPAHQL